MECAAIKCAIAPLRRTVSLAIRTVPIFASSSSSSSSSAWLPYAYAFEPHSSLRLPEWPSNPKSEADELDIESAAVDAEDAADASSIDNMEDEVTPAFKSHEALVTAEVTAANMDNDEDGDDDDDDDDDDDTAAAFLTVNTHASSGSSYTADTRPEPAAAALPPPRFAAGLIGASASPSVPGLEGLRPMSKVR